MAQTLIQVKDLKKYYNGGDVKALDGVTVDVYKGDVIAVIGPSGGGKSTLYGHCSELLVSEGQTVSRGQAIAKVGSTGWSTGPHLHFEVREDEQHVNPLPYLKGN